MDTEHVDLEADAEYDNNTPMLDVHMRVGDWDEVTVGHIARGDTADHTREALADLMHEAANYLTGDVELEDECHD